MVRDKNILTYWFWFGSQLKHFRIYCYVQWAHALHQICRLHLKIKKYYIWVNIEQFITKLICICVEPTLMAVVNFIPTNCGITVFILNFVKLCKSLKVKKLRTYCLLPIHQQNCYCVFDFQWIVLVHFLKCSINMYIDQITICNRFKIAQELRRIL